MNRQEFLDGLYTALAGEVSEDKRASDIRYYRDYISEEMSKGRSEEDVLTELGDPRLIARTIVDAQEAAAEEKYAYDTVEMPHEDSESGSYYGDDGYYRGEEEASAKVVTISGFKATLIMVAAVILIVGLLSFVFTAALKILLSPVFWVIIIGVTLFRAFTDRNGFF